MKRAFNVRVRKRDGTSKLLRNVYGTLRIGAVIKIPTGEGQFFGIEITAKPPSPDEPAEAKELEFLKQMIPTWTLRRSSPTS